MFVTFNTTTAGLVEKIRRKLNHPAGIGTVKWAWKDDGGAVHTEQLENTLYFPKRRSSDLSVVDVGKIDCSSSRKVNGSYWYLLPYILCC